MWLATSTCAGTQTGALLGYNNEGELSAWQNAPSSPSTTAAFLYDGQGQRVAQQVTQGGATTTTIYVGGAEETATSGATTTTTAYYYAGAKRIGLSVNGVVSYLAADGLGSADVTLSASGSPTASMLYAPYGGVRYSSGTMPTTYGFTGQRADSASGLDYYGSRYYDPLAGQFTSADDVLPGGGFDLWGLSRYAYVEGNPENRIDPTGRINLMLGDDDQGGATPASIENAFQTSTYAGIRQPYRPVYKSARAPKKTAATSKPGDRCGGCADGPTQNPAGPTAARTRLIIARASIIGETEPDPFLGWSQNVQEDFMKAVGGLGEFNSKKTDLEKDPQRLFDSNPAEYNRHIRDIRTLRAKLNDRLARIRVSSTEAADYLQPYVSEANEFDPVGVRGWAPLPRWMTAGVTEEGEPIPIVESTIVEDPLVAE
ncbi:MAG TPA: RHS repeat-associated core domain-containing protein [Candidatus Dormibacteraeota bacterium]|nr:RHS repeat-associated core domain-containing protein [Candidatus Dormibacteraeota bacterium]